MVGGEADAGGGSEPATLGELLAVAVTTDPLLTWSVIALTVVTALLPTAFVLATGAVIGALRPAVAAHRWTPPGGHLPWAVTATAGLFLLMQVLSPFRETLADTLMGRIDEATARRLMRLVSAPCRIGHLEDPVIADRLAQAQGAITGSTPGGAAYQLTLVWSRRLAGAASLVVVASFHWWLTPVLLATQVLMLRWRNRNWDVLTRVIMGQSDALRRSAYLWRLATGPEAAKESRVFGLDGWLVDGYRATFLESMAPVWLRRRRVGLLAVAVGLMGAAVTFWALALIVGAGIHGAIGLGAVVVYVQATVSVSGLGSFNENNTYAREGLAALGVLRDLERDLPDPAAAGPVADRPGPSLDRMPRSSIRFEGLRFRYPGRSEDLFEGLDLDIEVGRSIAIVGENGAGKTTLVKLLAGLYQPTGGRITVDGVDLCDLDQAAWQRRVAAIFQDFVRYKFTAYDNVAVGALHLASDRAAVEDAGRRAGAAALVEGLAQGWETPLSRQLTGGADLSGGEWQRLALARALLAVAGGATVLVLDEPTASLDVRAEAEIYDRFLDLTRGVTTVLISHRFSTVRRADRIVVVDGGRVVEDGTHDSLVAAGGHYARLYALQASRFLADEAVGDG